MAIKTTTGIDDRDDEDDDDEDERDVEDDAVITCDVDGGASTKAEVRWNVVECRV